MNDRIEFYHKDKLMTSVRSSIVPTVGSLINIQKKTWEIVGVTFTLDHSGEAFQDRSMRINVELEPSNG